MSGPDDPMGSTEVRLRAALASRADRTEPADDALDRLVAAADGVSVRDRRRRSVGLLAAAAALVAVVAVAVLVSRPGPERVDITDDPGRTTTTSPTTTSTTPEEAAVSPTTTVPETTTPPSSSTPASTPATTTTAPPTTTTETPPVLPGASTDPVSGSATGSDIAHLADIRVGVDDGYDRVVIEFAEGHLPDWSVRYVDPPINQDGSGEPIAVGGEAFLLVTMTPASGYTVDGEDVRPTYPGPSRLPGPGPQVVEVVQVGDFEAVATWAIGLRTRSPFRVTTLTSPARLIIDVAT